MAIEALDTVKSAFGRINTPTGLKVIGLLFVIQLFNTLGSMAYTAGTTAAALGALVTVLAGVASLVAMIGALRSFESGEFKKDQYTKNLFWPVTRNLGSNTITTLFGYGLGVAAALPIVGIVSLIGLGTGSIAGMALTAVGLVLAASAFIYVVLTLIVSVPMIATGDRRLFESLDLSVRRTSGNKKSMFLAALPIGALYLLATAVLVTLGPTQGTVNPAFGAASALISSTIAAAFFSLLTEYDHRLPEA